MTNGFVLDEENRERSESPTEVDPRSEKQPPSPLEPAGNGGADGQPGNELDEAAQLEDELRKQREVLENDWIVFRERIERSEKKEFYASLGIATSLFIFFWVLGSVVFHFTEKWDTLASIYFPFVTFTTIGYGDYTPTTGAGRAFFIVWALFGVGIMTVLLSVLGDAWQSHYKQIIASTHRRAKRRRRRRRGGEGGQDEETEAEGTRAGGEHDPEAGGAGAGRHERARSRDRPTTEEESAGLPLPISPTRSETLLSPVNEPLRLRTPLSPEEVEDLPTKLAHTAVSLHTHVEYLLRKQAREMVNVLHALPAVGEALPAHVMASEGITQEQAGQVLGRAEASGDAQSIEAAKFLFSVVEYESEYGRTVAIRCIVTLISFPHLASRPTLSQSLPSQDISAT